MRPGRKDSPTRPAPAKCGANSPPSRTRSTERHRCRAAKQGARLGVVFADRAKLQKIFTIEFPVHAALSNPLPLIAKQNQALSSGGEAIVLFSVADRESYVSPDSPFRLEASRPI
jgi:hypothetical protein